MQSLFFNPLTLILLLVLTILSFLFSASETSLIGLSRIRLRHMVARNIKRAQIIQHLIQRLDKFIVAILVGNNFVNIAISSIITGICVFFFGYKWGIAIATFLAAFFIVIICEITPKLLAIKHTERIALLIAPLMDVFIKLFSPIIAIFTGVSNVLIKLLRIPPAKRSPLISEEELRLMIEIGKEEGFVSDEEGKMLQRIFEFGDIKAQDVMVPKEEIVAVNINITSEQLLNIFVEKGHARLPVFQDSIDNIIGIVYAHDLLYILRDKGLFLLQDLLHEAYYVSPSTRVNELLRKFQSDKIQIAIVSDEHRRTLGLVTLEDLIEEIIGKVEERLTKRRSK
jgi:Mg2+/Co2+ transporter CorB